MKREHKVHLIVKHCENGRKSAKIEIFSGKNKVFGSVFMHHMDDILISLDKFLEKNKLNITNLNNFKIIAPEAQGALFHGQLCVLKNTLAFLNIEDRKK